MFSAIYSITRVGSSSTINAFLTLDGVLLFKTAVTPLIIVDLSSFVVIFSTSLTSNAFS